MTTPKQPDTRWEDSSFTAQYIDARTVVVMEHKRLLELLCSFYDTYISGNKNKRILDIGSGDGILAYTLIQHDPEVRATLIDGSTEMLKKAKDALKGAKNTVFLKKTFQELLESPPDLPAFSLAVSSLAIHHLTFEEKRAMFKFIYDHLDKGGSFVNIDLVRAPSEHLKEWYVQLWRQWIAEKKPPEQLRDEEYETRISTCLEESHYQQIDTLTDQMNLLINAGFTSVDVFFKHGIFAMYGGRK